MLLKLAWKLPAPMSLDGAVCGEGRDGGEGWRGRMEGRMEGKDGGEGMEGKEWRGRDGRKGWRAGMEGKHGGEGWRAGIEGRDGAPTAHGWRG